MTPLTSIAGLTVAAEEELVAVADDPEPPQPRDSGRNQAIPREAKAIFCVFKGQMRTEVERGARSFGKNGGRLATPPPV